EICSALIHLLQASGAAGGPAAPAKSAAPGRTAGAGMAGDPPAPRVARGVAQPPAWREAVPPALRAEERSVSARPGPPPAPAGPPPARPSVPGGKARQAAEGDAKPRRGKARYDRPTRTGREEGMATIFLNVGRKQLVTPADIVGKIAGVTRLPADV